MLGEFLSLCAGLFWACSIVLFKLSGDSISPVPLNIFKSAVSFILVLLTMVVLQVDFFPPRPLADWLWLAASGIIGITFSDLFLFMALNRLGASLTAIVECLYMPCVIFFSFLLLNEALGINVMIGGVLVLTAVIVGSMPAKPKNSSDSARKDENKDRSSNSGIPWEGLFLGCFSMVCVAIGIVIIKEMLSQINVFWATLVRVIAAIISLSIIVICHPKRRQYFKELKFSRAWIYALPASMCGNYLAILCWVGGMKYTTASKAAILNQMSTIFIFILAATFLKEKITPNRLIAIFLAMGGAFLTILG